MGLQVVSANFTFLLPPTLQGEPKASSLAAL